MLTDNFFRFWYAFAYRHLTDLENGDTDGVFEEFIRDDLHFFAATPFEKLCIDYLYRLNKMKKLPFRISEASRFWGKTTKTIDGKKQTVNLEIDVLARDLQHKNYIFGECKFTNEPFDMQQLKKLQAKVFARGNVYFYLFSLSGFTKAVREYANANSNVFLIDSNDVVSN